jgi:hypothetical protein
VCIAASQPNCAAFPERCLDLSVKATFLELSKKWLLSDNNVPQILRRLNLGIDWKDPQFLGSLKSVLPPLIVDSAPVATILMEHDALEAAKLLVEVSTRCAGFP